MGVWLCNFGGKMYCFHHKDWLEADKYLKANYPSNIFFVFACVIPFEVCDRIRAGTDNYKIDRATALSEKYKSFESDRKN